MRKNLLAIFVFLVILSFDIAFAKINKTNKFKTKRPIKVKSKAAIERIKRALNEDDEKPFWHNRGKKSISEIISDKETDSKTNKDINYFKQSDNDDPFWATRGRRDSISSENYDEYIENDNINPKAICKLCITPLNPKEFKNDMDDLTPFWGNRGRRNSIEKQDTDTNEAFWSGKDKQQEEDPFWGNRGRRKDEMPFWGSRGRRDDEPFWGNRGRRDDEPFWGNRGRREDLDPFWGNRGRREDSDPFWGNRGRRKESDPFWPSRGKRKDVLKNSILTALNDAENGIENLPSRKRNNRIIAPSYWKNQGRDRKLRYLFNGSLRIRNPFVPIDTETNHKHLNPGSVQDGRIYAEQPNYILIERSSRSSSEEDPYYIARGKKVYLNLSKAARDRRGALEEIVKTVRNDPYYIARGKKRVNYVKFKNTNEALSKVKELVCAAIELTVAKEGNKVRRELNENDRDRRTLKKLAAQLQADPYFVSRGKKNDSSDRIDDLTNFINDLAEKCN